MSKPFGSLLQSRALLSWVPEHEVLQYFDEKEKDINKEKNDDIKRKQWKKHKLFKTKKDALVSMCNERKLETFSMKHEHVERLALESDEEPPCEPPLYDGKGKLPQSEIGRLSKSYLRSILSSHGLATCGTRDEFILRVGLIANNMERRSKTVLLTYSKRRVVE